MDGAADEAARQGAWVWAEAHHAETGHSVFRAYTSYVLHLMGAEAR
ncbi:hypothetical protein STTU_0817 [Streptomyces sp. Tu6071]|nr:hypothetical protein STTU_0817 [Streptomyces sp. Tu6071]